ncbi:MAG: hypothetical protein KGJ78_03590 [Alphaproteobacteria bacterium]|nr:hypothetical protein [Alphaproteobacteria bacterium]
MKCSVRTAWITAAIVAAPAFAQMEGPQPPDGPMIGLQRSNDRQEERLLRAFDLNHDGKVTHDEMNRTIGARFAAATNHAPGMALSQFTALHLAEFRQHAANTFRRLDWDGNGRLSLAEYAAPQRVRFMTLDEGGAAAVSCAQKQQPARGTSRRSSYGRSNYSLAGFCFDNDLNRDGTVSRSELDAAVGKRFAAAAGGASFITPAQYTSSEEERFTAANARTFQRLDRDNDGALTIQEFATTPLRLFARLDRNKDRMLTADEIQPRSRYRSDARRLDD